MDESWRMRMGISGTNSRRRSAEKTPPETSELEPEDFDDVYGGPPRSVLARKHSVDFTNSEWFYRDIFREPTPEMDNLSGRRLPEFVIPARRRESEGWAETGTGKSNWSKSKGKCMMKSKSTSSSGWSFEDLELNPYLPVGAQDPQDVALSSFTSKLRPINVPGKWSSSSSTTTKNKKQELPPFGSSTKGPYNNNHNENYDCNDYMLKSFNYGFPQRTSSLETLNVGSTTTLGLSAMDEYDDMHHLESPSSAVSSFSQPRTIGFNSDHEVIHMNSWTPEVKIINSEAIDDIDEAIAWAKEKFQG